MYSYTACFMVYTEVVLDLPVFSQLLPPTMTQFLTSIGLSDNLMISYFAAFESKPVSPHCFVLPAQTKLLLQDIKEGRSQFFTLKSLESISTPFQNWRHTASSTSEKMYILILLF